MLEADDPRYLKMAKDRINQRRDYQCQDCGYIGVEAPDERCPECGGVLAEPDDHAPETAEGVNPEVTPAAIRDAIFRRLQRKQQS